MRNKLFTLLACLLMMACGKDDGDAKGLAEVTTKEVSNIRASNAVGGGNVITGGSSTITSRGVCWSTSPNPTINDSYTSDGDGTGPFNSQISNLSPSTNYYVRAYVANNSGIAYGNQVNFTSAPMPTVDFWVIRNRLFQVNTLGAAWVPNAKALTALSSTTGAIFSLTFKEKPTTNGVYQVKDAANTKLADLNLNECYIALTSPTEPKLFSSAEGGVVNVTVGSNGKLNINYTDLQFKFMDTVGETTTTGTAVIQEK